MESDHDITDLLIAWRSGERGAFDRLFSLVYDELRRVAHRRLGREREGHTLDTTALVNEAYLRLVDQTRARWADRAQFFAVAARAMRRILVDHARRHQALKRGGAPARVRFDDDALTRLAELDERLCRVVECRFFAGFTEEETAEVLAITPRTVRRDWAKAKGWLYQALRE